MLVFVDYLSFNKQRLPYLFRRDTYLQSMFVVQSILLFIAILTPSVVVSHPMLDLNTLTQKQFSFYAGTLAIRNDGFTGVKTTSRDIAHT